MFSFRYPAVVILTAIIIGTLAGRFIDISYLWLIAALSCAAIIILLCFNVEKSTKIVGVIVILFCCLSYGNAIRLFQPVDTHSISSLASAINHTPVRVFGRIDKWPVLKQHRTLIVCDVDSLAYDDSIHNATGLVLITVNRTTTQFMLGDRIAVLGRLRVVHKSSAMQSFDYSRWLKNQGILARFRINDPATILVDAGGRGLFVQSVDWLRKWISGVFVKYLDEVPAAMAAGYLIGETRNIPEDVYLAFRSTGTMHLLAVSGSNVALVLVVALFILKPFRMHRYMRFGILTILIILFSHLSYNQPSVVRASVMAILILAGRTLYRRVDLNNIIAAAAVMLILYNPSNLFDVGFQLSFAVTWGLVLFLPIFHELLMQKVPKEWQRYILLIVFCSVIASAVATPITVYYFGTFPAVTVFSNLLVVPLVSLAVIGIVVLLIAAAIYPPLAVIPAAPLNILLDVTNRIVLWFDSLHFNIDAPISISGIEVIVFIVGACLLFLSFRYLFIRRLFVFYSLLVILAINVAAIAKGDKPEGRFVCFNTGAVQGMYIDRGGGLLVLTSGSGSRLDALTSEIIPYIRREFGHLPAYCLFYEPEYVVHQYTNEIAEAFPGYSIIPAGTGHVDSVGYLRRCLRRDDEYTGPAIPGPTLQLMTGACIVRDTATSVACLCIPEICREIQLIDYKYINVVVARVSSKGDIEAVRSIPPADRLVVLDATPSKLRKVLRGSGMLGVLGARHHSVSILAAGDMLVIETGYID